MMNGQRTVIASKWRIVTAIAACLLLVSCDWDFDRDDFCYFTRPSRRMVSFKTPRSLTCFGYSGQFSAAISTIADPDVSAFLIGLSANIFIIIFVNPDTLEVVGISPALPLAVLRGTAVPSAVGLHINLTGTNPLAGFSGRETLSLDVKEVPGGPATITGTGNLLPSVDPHGVDIGIRGTQTASLNPSPCYSPGFFTDPGSLLTGEFTDQPEPDLSLGGTPPVAVRRIYGSLTKFNGVSSALGDNWMDNFDVKLALNGNIATVIHLGGGTIEFAKSGSTWSLKDPQPLPYQLAQSGANYQFSDPDQNMIYTFSSTGAMIRVEDRNGNALTVTQGANGPTQVSDGLGRTLTFTYNAQNKLGSISDQSGRMVSYGYTGSNLTTFTDAAGKVTTYTYTTAGGLPALITSVKRPAGNITVTNIYDSFGRVSKQTDALNNATTFAYSASTPGTTTQTDALGNQTKTTHTDLLHHDSITDALGKITTIAWDLANRPTSLLDRLGGRTTATYDPNAGQASTATAADGSSVSQTYIAQTQGLFTFYLVSKQTFADGTSLNYQYDANGNVTSETDAYGAVTQSTYDSHGNQLTEKNALGGVTTSTYGSDGTLTSVKSPAGDLTQYAYDSLKRVNKVTLPDASSQSFTYDALDRVTNSTTFDDNGNIKSLTAGGGTTFTYDALDRATSRTVNGGTRSVAYDALGRAKTLTDEAGEKENIAYDAVGRTASIADGAGAGYKFTWNAQGFLQSVTDPNAQTTTLSTDAVARVLASTTPLGEKSTSAYDKAGRRISSTSPLLHTAKFSYTANSLSRIDLPLSITALYARNANSQLTGVTDPNGNVWVQNFDSQGRRMGFADPLGHATTVRFDNRDRIISAANPLGNVNLVYSAQGDLTQQAFSDGLTLNFQFAGGQLTGADGLTLGYDANNRINLSNGIASTRDAVGRLLTITYAAGKTVTYKYTSLGLLGTIQDWVGGTTTFTYDAAHRLLSIQRPNGTKTTYTRDANGRIVSIAEAVSGGAYSIALTLDAEGNAIAANRTLPQPPLPAGGVASYAYDQADQLTAGTYDAMGRLLSDSVRKYTWDLASRLTSYSGGDGSAQFTYDGLGLRVSSTSGSSTVNYVWNYAHDLPALAVVRSGGADLSYNIFLPDGTWLYTVNAANNARGFGHFDEEGSTVFLTNDNGTVTDSYGVTAFGESVTHTGTSNNPFTFHGAYGVMQEGNTSLYYMRSRFYDSTTGRFLSRDPSPSAEPLEINPYQFALNNPLGFQDSTGRTTVPQFWGGSGPERLGYDWMTNDSSRAFLSGRGRGSMEIRGIRMSEGFRGDDEAQALRRVKFTAIEWPGAFSMNPFRDVSADVRVPTPVQVLGLLPIISVRFGALSNASNLLILLTPQVLGLQE